MKQTQNTHVCSLAREGEAPYSLARGVLATITGESGEAAVCSMA